MWCFGAELIPHLRFLLQQHYSKTIYPDYFYIDDIYIPMAKLTQLDCSQFDRSVTLSLVFKGLQSLNILVRLARPLAEIVNNRPIDYR